MAGEFSIIAQFFDRAEARADIELGIGDDAAIINLPAGEQLVITTDTLNAGIHFPDATGPGDIAYKSVMVNLSDLAAMGATPRWLTLSLSMPEPNHDWLRVFSDNLFQALKMHQVALIGGDTTRGPLSLCVTAFGTVKPGTAMRRDSAQIGDVIAVTGTLGDAGLGLQCALHQRALNRIEHTGIVMSRLNRPQARVNEAIALREYCECAIDLSDGLASDLMHILKRSDCSASIDVANLPFSEVLLQECEEDERIALALSAGDDYELCVCIAPEKFEAAQKALRAIGSPLTAIGSITANEEGPEIDWRKSGHPYPNAKRGWEHFV
ncbi:thiamine-phosphate kinase [Permianibacter aggregans]|uniref:Thiamine-monophosphate kinase n=1 Tax=Permianibacter aggregans TaxID=1510150 RepID=A0A4R6UVY5_9GAMM|nr:thiamine-phosphate kinase [Permianibacter aggregans]TDQ47684.1 thiamine-phosphate kinase [Permianibacter aggregans]